MKAIIDSAFSHARTTLSAFLLILISGGYAYLAIPKEAEPDVNIPIIYVQMTHEGISPEDAERLLIRPMEQELRSIEGVREIRSRGYEGGANVLMEFEAGFNVDKAMTDVREQVDLVKPDLPDDTDEPTVNEVNLSLLPILIVTLSGDFPERALLRLARDLRDAVEGIPAVLEATISGDREEMAEILIDPVKMESYGLNADEAIATVKRSNLLVAAGAQDTGRGRFSLKVPGLLENIFDIMNLPIKVEGDAVVRLRDIGEVRRTFKDPTSFSRVDGHRAIVLEVSKRVGSNLIETTKAVRAIVEAERAAWPVHVRNVVKISYAQDKSTFIKAWISDLENNVIAAVLLVLMVIVAVLGSRSAILVGIAIPGSFLAGILVIYTLGHTMNMVVLFGMILAVGMLVDGAIVVTEYADRKMTEGEGRKTAYGMAAKRMSWPIIASTATTLAAFLPLMFWPGIVGQFMWFLPLTLIATLSASLLMALIFVPTIGSFIGRAGGSVDREEMEVLAAGKSDIIECTHGVTCWYLQLLDRALNHPGRILVSAALLMVVVQIGYGLFGKGLEFFPEVEPEFAQLQVRARGNLSTYEKHTLMKDVESRIIDVKGIRTFYVRTGRVGQSEQAEDIIGVVNLEFDDWDKRRKAELILGEVEDKTGDLAGIIISVRKEESGPPAGRPIHIQLSSRFPGELEPAVVAVLAAIKDVEGLINLEDSRPLPGIDWEFKVDRAQAAKFGADISAIGQAMRLVTGGIQLGDYRPDDTDEEVDIRARYPVAYRTLEQLSHIRVTTPGGQVPISNFVTLAPRQSTGTIARVDARRVMTVKADVAEGILSDDKVREIEKKMAGITLPPGVDISFRGEDEEQAKAQDFLVKAFGVALFIMAIILVTQFNSFYSAFLILSAVVMSTIGVFIGLLLTGQPFGIVMGGIGIIALAGIVVNNNIVLIDTFDRLKQSENTIRDAILRTGAQRLRPVLLTTVTTMLGLMPMVLGVNIDFIDRDVLIGAPATQLWRQLSTSIVFGLGFATVLTLVVTPSALMLKENIAARWRAHSRGV